MIYFYSIASLIFILNLILKSKNKESFFYKAKQISLYTIAVVYIGLLAFDTYKFYNAQNPISNSIDKEFILELKNNSKNEMNLRFMSIKQNEDSYDRYYLNKIKIDDPNHLLQIIKIKAGQQSNYKFKIPYSAFILIQDMNSGKGIKIYRTDIKMRIYATDFKRINENIKQNNWNEYVLAWSNFAFYFIIIFFITQLPKKIIPKIGMLIILLLFFIISSYNLYILVRLIGGK